MCAFFVVLWRNMLFAFICRFYCRSHCFIHQRSNEQKVYEKQQEERVRKNSLYGSARQHSLEKQHLGKMLVQLEFLNVNFWDILGGIPLLSRYDLPMPITSEIICQSIHSTKNGRTESEVTFEGKRDWEWSMLKKVMLPYTHLLAGHVWNANRPLELPNICRIGVYTQNMGIYPE